MERDGVVEKEVVGEGGEGRGRWNETKLQKKKSQGKRERDGT